MTARQIIRARCENAVLWMMVLMAAIVALAIVEPGPRYAWIVIVLVVAFGIVGTYANWVIDCPKCHVAFGRMVWQVSYPNMVIMPIKFCPHCALVLDNPWPAKAT